MLGFGATKKLASAFGRLFGLEINLMVPVRVFKMDMIMNRISKVEQLLMT